MILSFDLAKRLMITTNLVVKIHHFVVNHKSWPVKLNPGLVPGSVKETECFVILGHFLPFYPTNNLKNQKFEKIKNNPRDKIILHKFTKNHDNMLYCSWDKACDVCKPGDIIILPMCTKNYKLWSHDVWFLRYGA